MKETRSSESWKFLWRERASQWLRNEKHFIDLNPDSLITILKNNPTSCEAAFALFWFTYLSDRNYPFLTTEQIYKIRDLFEDCNIGQNVEGYQDAAFVNFHLAGLLATCFLKTNYSVCENPGVFSILEKGFKLSQLFSIPDIDYGDPKAWGKKVALSDLYGFSSILIEGIIFIEFALYLRDQSRYEEALGFMSLGAWRFLVTSIPRSIVFSKEAGSHEFKDDNFSPYIPSTGYEYDMQLAADIFELILKHPKGIKWEQIKDICDEEFIALATYDYNETIVDSTNESISAIEYWNKAEAIAEERLKILGFPYTVLTQGDKEFIEAEQKLKRDFFSDNWQEIPLKAWDLLVYLESDWERNGPNDIKSMMENIRSFLEIMLSSVFVCLSPIIENPDSPAKHLYLNTMSIQLQENPNVQSMIRNMKIAEDDKKWSLNELPRFLKEVVHLRNYYVKKRYLTNSPEIDKDMLNRAKSIHRELLGIGCHGVLHRMLKIKQKNIGCKEKQ